MALSARRGCQHCGASFGVAEYEPLFEETMLAWPVPDIIGGLALWWRQEAGAAGSGTRIRRHG
jgi:hypothetical protein